jgi:hypothetical protein
MDEGFGVWVCRFRLFLSRFGWIIIGALHDPRVAGLESLPVQDCA